MQRTGDARAAQRLLRREFLANRHQAGHLGLGDRHFLAPPVGESEVGNFEVGEIPGVGHSVHQSLLVGDRAVGSSLVTPRASRGSTSAVAKSEVPRAWQGGAAKRLAILLQRSSRRTTIIAQARPLPSRRVRLGRLRALDRCLALHEQCARQARLTLVEALGMESLLEGEELVVEVMAKLVDHACAGTF